MEDPPWVPLPKPIAPHRNAYPELDARLVPAASIIVIYSFKRAAFADVLAARFRLTELWALLHFIMPSLFDSHDEFSEWFSRDIENAASGQDKNNLNEHQLRRLHMILKPFMLRRVKKNVQNELGDKVSRLRIAVLHSSCRIELTYLYCPLSFADRDRCLRQPESASEIALPEFAFEDLHCRPHGPSNKLGRCRQCPFAHELGHAIPKGNVVHRVLPSCSTGPNADMALLIDRPRSATTLNSSNEPTSKHLLHLPALPERPLSCARARSSTAPTRRRTRSKFPSQDCSTKKAGYSTSPERTPEQDQTPSGCRR